MVKNLDEKSDADLPDHIGWRLWQANRVWQAEFAATMRLSGHNWFTEARAGLLGHIDRNGTRQTSLIERAGISKQAVQQLLDGLEADGVIERAPDAADRRGKIVRYTPYGLKVLGEADRVKMEIETRYRARIGTELFEAMMKGLRVLESTHQDASGI